MEKERCSISRFGRRVTRVSKKCPSHPMVYIIEETTNGGNKGGQRKAQKITFGKKSDQSFEEMSQFSYVLYN